MGMGREFGRVWNARVHDIGNFQSRVLLTVFYFTIFVPFAMLTRLFSDPLHLHPRGSTTAWSPWSDRGADLDAARRQF